MRRTWPPVSALAVLLLGALAFAGLRPAVAQDATPAAGAAAMAGHPLVGAWILDTDVDDPANPPTLALFTSDGIYQQADPDGSDGYGSWEATGPSSGAMTFVGQFPLGEDESAGIGSTTVRAAIMVDAGGQTLTAEYTVGFVGIEGAPTGEVGPGRASGTRIVVEPMGTPVASLAEAFAGGGTPAASTPAP